MTTLNSDPNRRSTDNTPHVSGNGTLKQKAEEDIENVKREVGSTAREKAEAGQRQIGDGADALSDAIDAAASNLDDHDREGLARYARKLSSDISNAAAQLESRSVDELAKDVKQLARNNPALFMLGSIAVGFGLSRFFKASAEHEHRDADKSYRADSFRSDDTATGGSTQHPSQQYQTDTYGTSTAPRTSTTQQGDGRNIL